MSNDADAEQTAAGEPAAETAGAEPAAEETPAAPAVEESGAVVQCPGTVGGEPCVKTVSHPGACEAAATE